MAGLDAPMVWAPNLGVNLTLREWVRTTQDWVGQISQVVVDRAHIPQEDEVLFDGDGHLPSHPGVQFVLLLQGEMVGEPGKDDLTRSKTGGKPTWSGSEGELRVGSRGSLSTNGAQHACSC